VGVVEKLYRGPWAVEIGKGKICLVHNAAILVRDTTLDTDVDQLRRALEVNVVAPAALNKLLFPHMDSES
jgi:NAD(P)-dependent dehydrogenase (short-subunit alcohol dehydrogenase family)